MFVLIWLSAAAWLFLRPHEAILGGADAGVYVSTAAHVAREGQLLVQDDTLAQMDPALHAAVLRPIPGASLTPAYLFPGFNVVDAGAGVILPDFFHYHPTWQAVAYTLGDSLGGATTGLQAALLLPGLWALLGALAVYLTVHQAFVETDTSPGGNLRATPAALLALGALSLNAIQVWFARYPVTETLTQALLWTGLWALGAWLAQRRPFALWGLLAGLSLGLVLLTRIDMVFILAIPALILIWQRSRSRLRAGHLWFYTPLGLLTLHMALHGAFISRPYFTRIVDYTRSLGPRFWPIIAVLIIVALASLWLLLCRGQKPHSLARRATHAPDRAGRYRSLRAVVILALLALATYAWFVRPVYGAIPSYNEWYDGQTITLTDRENLRRLGWYLGPVGVWLGVAGAGVLIWRANRRSAAFLGVGLFFSLLYIWRIQANPHQIYAMRRYVPVVMPFFIAGGATLVHFLVFEDHNQRLRSAISGSGRAARTLEIAGRALGLLLALTWLAGIVWSARGFVTQVDHRRLSAQLAQLDGQLPPNSVLFFDDQAPVSLGDILGTPLRFAFEHDVYTIRDPASLDRETLVKSIERWQNSGRSVYWIGAADWLQESNLAYTPSTVTITTHALEGSYDHKPHRINEIIWTLNLNRIEPQ